MLKECPVYATDSEATANPAALKFNCAQRVFLPHDAIINAMLRVFLIRCPCKHSGDVPNSAGNNNSGISATSYYGGHSQWHLGIFPCFLHHRLLIR